MGVEFNTGYFSTFTAISSLLLYLPFALRVHENCRVKSFWCIPGEKELLSIALLNLVQKQHHTAHATCRQLPNLWGNFSSWADEQASQEYSTTTERLKASDASSVSFSTLISLEQLLFYCVPWRSHLNHIHGAGMLSVNPWSGSHVTAEMMASLLAKVQRHQRALRVQFDLGFEGYISCSSTNISGRFSETFDIAV